ncbi:MAG: alpha-glucosidase/alpha-galactosidase [Clostridia bacterium]|nr:alpha-glucosidase/alpha-galactosidase [Clostridia bacterium]
MRMEIKIAYIGGGSRGWAWGLMSDLAMAEDLQGTVALYDIDHSAAKANEIIGNRYSPNWKYRATETIGEALEGADFVVISILPGTFEEMDSDVHAPEAYGIWQSVGDSTGPGGIVRAMRTVPMFEVIAKAIRQYAPKAWVINYTNPMTLCVRTLYRTFPEIRAFGCCHEVFGTQKLLARVVNENFGILPERKEIEVEVVGVNHFTFLKKASWNGHDLFPLYEGFCEKYKDGYPAPTDQNWMNNFFRSEEKVKMDLFCRFGSIAAAGDRHLAEFCPGSWYLESPERVREMKFRLTTVRWRKERLAELLAQSRALVSGEKEIVLKKTGEEGVRQMRALLGLRDLVTNVNIPNVGQIPNLPLGAVVETNALFSKDGVKPLETTGLPTPILPLVGRIAMEQEGLNEGLANRDVGAILQQFTLDPLVRCRRADAEELFFKMCDNTKEYLSEYGF